MEVEVEVELEVEEDAEDTTEVVKFCCDFCLIMVMDDGSATMVIGEGDEEDRLPAAAVVWLPINPSSPNGNLRAFPKSMMMTRKAGDASGFSGSPTTSTFSGLKSLCMIL